MPHSIARGVEPSEFKNTRLPPGLGPAWWLWESRGEILTLHPTPGTLKLMPRPRRQPTGLKGRDRQWLGTLDQRRGAWGSGRPGSTSLSAPELSWSGECRLWTHSRCSLNDRQSFLLGMCLGHWGEPE